MIWTSVRYDDATGTSPHRVGAGDRDGDRRTVSALPGNRDRGTHRRRGFLRSWLVAAVTGALLLTSPARANGPVVPSAVAQEILIKSSLLTLNDANDTGNYAVLHAKFSKPVREQFSEERVKQSFKEFADKKVDFKVIVAESPIATRQAHIDDRGALVLRGYFGSSSSRLVYELDFLPSEGEWKPLKLAVHLNPIAEKQLTSTRPSQ
jgi:hypothetical protein